jgi:hypothetical protein
MSDRSNIAAIAEFIVQHYEQACRKRIKEWGGSWRRQHG